MVPVDYQGENLASIKGMKKLFAQGKAKHLEYLRDMYGDYVEKLFYPPGEPTYPRHLVTSPYGFVKNVLSKGQLEGFDTEKNNGLEHFVHKLKLKIVQAQLKWLEEKNPTTTVSRFIHVHGGHRYVSIFFASFTLQAHPLRQWLCCAVPLRGMEICIPKPTLP